MLLKCLLLAALLPALAGCANPYEKFYQGDTQATQHPDYIPRTGPVELYSTSDFQRDRDALVRRGYAPLGFATFNAGMNNVSESQIRAQADKVGAHIVLISSQYTHTVTGAVPLELPNTSTATTTGTASIYGPGSHATGTATATTRTYSSQTVMMPYAVQRADFGALFFAKRTWSLGIESGDIDAATRRRLQTNGGVLARIIVEGTPAFDADILPGDIVLELDGKKTSPDTFFRAIDELTGRTVALLIDRDGTRLTKQVTLRD